MAREVSLERLVDRLVRIVQTIELPILQARYDFPVRSMTLTGQPDVLKIGGAFMLFLIAQGQAKARMDPTALDIEFAGGLFVDKVARTYGQYGGFTGAVMASVSGEMSGLQGVFNRCAEAHAAEISRLAVGFIYQDEVDELDEGQVKSICRQLQRREGMENVSLYRLMPAWKELVMAIVQQRRGLMLRFGQAPQQEEGKE